jgi:hypothetical protein
MEKRYSKGLAVGAHYTWSAYIDTASEVFNPAVNGDIAVAQDSFNWRSDRARSTYDRPQRFSFTHAWQIPGPKGMLNKVAGGWQINGFLTFQSGAPFTPLLGTDPFLRVSGIDGLVGNSVRPNAIAGVNLNQSVGDLYGQRTQLFAPFVANAATAGRAMAVGDILQVGGTPIGLGNAGRNLIRADGIGNYDFGVLKIINITERHALQIRADFFNLTNTRNFGIPESRINSGNFLNQWGQDGGNRRIQFGLRYGF